METKYVKLIRVLEIKRHELKLAKINKHHHNFRKEPEMIIARGSLVGDFYQNTLLGVNEIIDFIGDFDGFFEVQKDWSGEDMFFFEGRIVNITVLAINGSTSDDRIMELNDIFFTGYFKGQIWRCQKMEKTYKPVHRFTGLENLMQNSILHVNQQENLLIPAFTRFAIKNIASVNLDKSIAQVSGILTIELQFSEYLTQFFNMHPELSLILTFNRNSPILLPLSINSKNQSSESQSDIEMDYFNSNHIMRYTIRSKFIAEIDSSYNQFFAPFNLVYLKIIIKMLDTTFRTKSTFGDLHLKFININLTETTANNPYETFNSLLDSKRQDLASNRITKIRILENLECGQYIQATNHLALFPYHSNIILNSRWNSKNKYWNFGLIPKDYYLCEPKVLSIKQQFEERQEKAIDGKNVPTKLFKVSTWNNLHIEIPIYKYWVVNAIQILIPLFILSALSLLIFMQENGLRQEGIGTLNYRILNVASIMIAYVALIPLIRQNAPRATYVSFLYVIIYLSMIPNILAIVQGLMNQDILNSQWNKTYRAFQDVLFLVSFIMIIIFLTIVIVVAFYFIRSSSSDYQIRKTLARNPNKLEEAKNPLGFDNHLKNITEKRKNQFIFHDIKESMNTEFLQI